MFAAPPVIEAEIYTRLPEELRLHDRPTEWSRRRGDPPLHSFLEGPAFDRAGNFYCTDLNHGRIFRITPGRRWEVFAEYDGGPNGLKIHRDGRIFVACRKYGVIAFDPVTARRTVIADRERGRPFNALNDLCFADNGDLYFTDPGASSLGNPVGRVLRLTPAGEVSVIAEGLPYTNGLVLSPRQDMLFVAITRSLQVIRISLLPDGAGRRHYASGCFVQMSGGLAGPDGMAVDERGSIAVAHAGFGAVWLFNRLGEPMARINSPDGIRTTNVAYGGADGRDLFITESEDGAILRARMPVPGRAMFSHQSEGAGG